MKKMGLLKAFVHFCCWFIPSRKARRMFRRAYIKKESHSEYSINGKNNHIYIIENGIEKEYTGIIDNLSISIKGCNNIIKLEKPFVFFNASININNNNNCTVTIKRSKGFRWCVNFFPGFNNMSFYIDEYSLISGWGIVQMLDSGSRLVIGKHFLCACNFNLWTGDAHTIINKDGDIINRTENTLHQIGDHVWCGANVTLTKKASLPSNSIVAMGSVVTKEFKETNVILAGNPAVIVKRGVSWEYPYPEDYSAVQEKEKEY